MVRLHRITQSFSSLKWESAWKKSQLSAERNSTDWWFLAYCNVRQAKKKKKIYIVPEWFPWLDLQTWDSEIRWLDTLPAPENWELKAGRPGDADGLRPGLHSLPRLLHVCAQLCLVRPPFLPSDLNLQIPSQSGLLPLPFPNLLFISLSPPNRTHIVLVYLLPHHLKVPWGQRFWSVLFTSWTLKCLERCQAFNGHSVDICWASA